MQGAYKGKDTTIRYALIGAVILILVIVTIILISGGLTGGGGNASPTATPTTTTGCLYPSTGVRTALMLPHSPAYKGSRFVAKRRLAKIERAYARHTSNFVIVSRSGQHYIAASGSYVLGALGKKAKKQTPSVLHVPATDLAFNASGNHILYTVTAASSKYSCASVVLYAMALNGTNKRLLLATRYPLLNGGPSGRFGTLASDELPNGWIVLVGSSGKLYAFNPARHVLGPIQTSSLGRSYLNSGSASQRQVQVTVSPNGKYFTETNSSATGFAIKSMKTGAVVKSVASGTPEAWSFSGSKLAYIKHETKAGSPIGVIDTISLPKGKTHIVKANRKKYGALTLSHVLWSRDNRWVGFTGTATGCSTAGGCKVYAFIGTAKGKHVHKVGASKALKKHKNKGKPIP